MIKWTLGAVLFLLTAYPFCSAQTPEKTLGNKTFDLGISAGVLLPGNLYASDALEDESFSFTLRKNTSFLLRFIADAYLVPQLALGGFINLSPITLSEEVQFGTWSGESQGIPSSGIFHN